jgi:hypothetical protein
VKNKLTKEQKITIIASWLGCSLDAIYNQLQLLSLKIPCKLGFEALGYTWGVHSVPTA